MKQKLIDQLLHKVGARFGAEGTDYSDFTSSKFAELIVQECMNAVCDPSTTHLESMTDASAMYTARERIRKHFRS